MGSARRYAVPLHNAFTGALIGHAGAGAPDVRRCMTMRWRQAAGASRDDIHDRARMLKALAQYLSARKDELYELSYLTGATKSDSWIDIDGGIGTTFVFASKGRREMPTRMSISMGMSRCCRGAAALLASMSAPASGRGGAYQRLQFPGLGHAGEAGADASAGMPAIVKPATATGYLAEAAFG